MGGAAGSAATRAPRVRGAHDGAPSDLPPLLRDGPAQCEDRRPGDPIKERQHVEAGPKLARGVPYAHEGRVQLNATQSRAQSKETTRPNLAEADERASEGLLLVDCERRALPLALDHVRRGRVVDEGVVVRENAEEWVDDGARIDDSARPAQQPISARLLGLRETCDQRAHGNDQHWQANGVGPMPSSRPVRLNGLHRVKHRACPVSGPWHLKLGQPGEVELGRVLAHFEPRRILGWLRHTDE